MPPPVIVAPGEMAWTLVSSAGSSGTLTVTPPASAVPVLTTLTATRSRCPGPAWPICSIQPVSFSTATVEVDRSGWLCTVASMNGALASPGSGACTRSTVPSAVPSATVAEKRRLTSPPGESATVGTVHATLSPLGASTPPSKGVTLARAAGVAPTSWPSTGSCTATASPVLRSVSSKTSVSPGSTAPPLRSLRVQSLVEKSALEVTTTVVGSLTGVARSASVSTGAAKPSALICAWLGTTAPLGSGVASLAVKLRVSGGPPGATSPSCQVIAPAAKTPPSLGTTSTSRGSIGSVMTAFLATASPWFASEIVHTSSSPGLASPPLLSTTVLSACEKSTALTTVSRVGSPAVGVVGSSEGTGPAASSKVATTCALMGRPSSSASCSVATTSNVSAFAAPTPSWAMGPHETTPPAKLPPALGWTLPAAKMAVSSGNPNATFSASAVPSFCSVIR